MRINTRFSDYIGHKKTNGTASLWFIIFLINLPLYKTNYFITFFMPFSDIKAAWLQDVEFKYL